MSLRFWKHEGWTSSWTQSSQHFCPVSLSQLRMFRSPQAFFCRIGLRTLAWSVFSLMPHSLCGLLDFLVPLRFPSLSCCLLHLRVLALRPPLQSMVVFTGIRSQSATFVHFLSAMLAGLHQTRVEHLTSFRRQSSSRAIHRPIRLQLYCWCSLSGTTFAGLSLICPYLFAQKLLRPVPLFLSGLRCLGIGSRRLCHIFRHLFWDALDFFWFCSRWLIRTQIHFKSPQEASRLTLWQEAHLWLSRVQDHPLRLAKLVIGCLTWEDIDETWDRVAPKPFSGNIVCIVEQRNFSGTRLMAATTRLLSVWEEAALFVRDLCLLSGLAGLQGTGRFFVNSLHQKHGCFQICVLWRHLPSKIWVSSDFQYFLTAQLENWSELYRKLAFLWKVYQLGWPGRELQLELLQVRIHEVPQRCTCSVNLILPSHVIPRMCLSRQKLSLLQVLLQTYQVCPRLFHWEQTVICSVSVSIVGKLFMKHFEVYADIIPLWILQGTLKANSRFIYQFCRLYLLFLRKAFLREKVEHCLSWRSLLCFANKLPTFCKGDLNLLEIGHR